MSFSCCRSGRPVRDYMTSELLKSDDQALDEPARYTFVQNWSAGPAGYAPRSQPGTCKRRIGDVAPQQV